MCIIIFFFFSSRRRHTRLTCDWSSDVCSSDLGIDGLIHISDMSWTKRVQHPSEVVKKGDEVDVLILNVDAENKRISLGLKQAQEDPWLRIGETYPVGTELRGRVMRLMDKG